jgi:hypothetical protein
MKNLFENCKTLDEAKKLYYKLAMQLHPDKGGLTSDFQELQSQFEKFKPESLKYKNELNDWKAADYATIINHLLLIPEIQITICGSWIWVHGNTKPYKDAIKSTNTNDTYRIGWCKKKLQWYFSPVGYRKRSNAMLTFEEIKELYGEQNISRTNKVNLMLKQEGGN